MPRDLHCSIAMVLQEVLEVLVLQVELEVLQVVGHELELKLQHVQEGFPKLLELHVELQDVLHEILHRP